MKPHFSDQYSSIPWQPSTIVMAAGLASMMLIALYDLPVSLASGITEPPKSGLVDMVPLPLRHSTSLPQMSQKLVQGEVEALLGLDFPPHCSQSFHMF